MTFDNIIDTIIMRDVNMVVDKENSS